MKLELTAHAHVYCDARIDHAADACQRAYKEKRQFFFHFRNKNRRIVQQNMSKTEVFRKFLDGIVFAQFIFIINE